MKVNQICAIVLASSLTFGMVSCGDDEETATPTNPVENTDGDITDGDVTDEVEDTIDEETLELFEDINSAISAGTDAMSLVSQGSAQMSVGGKTTQDCPSWSFDGLADGSQEITMIVDFGEGCEQNGVTMSGKMTSTFNRVGTEGGNITYAIVYEDLSTGGQTLNGSMTMTMNLSGMTDPQNINMAMSLVMDDFTITTAEEGTFSFSADYDYAITTAQTEVSGTFEGTTADGLAYTGEISTPLTMVTDCIMNDNPYPNLGVMTVTASNINFGIDYSADADGNSTGACDSYATVSKGPLSSVKDLSKEEAL